MATHCHIAAPSARESCLRNKQQLGILASVKAYGRATRMLSRPVGLIALTRACAGPRCAVPATAAPAILNSDCFHPPPPAGVLVTAQGSPDGHQRQHDAGAMCPMASLLSGTATAPFGAGQALVSRADVGPAVSQRQTTWALSGQTSPAAHPRHNDGAERTSFPPRKHTHAPGFGGSPRRHFS